MLKAAGSAAGAAAAATDVFTEGIAKYTRVKLTKNYKRHRDTSEEGMVIEAWDKWDTEFWGQENADK